MAFTASAIFQQWLLNPMCYSLQGSGNLTLPTSYSTTGGIKSDSIKCALFGNTGTPSKSAAVGLTGYAAASSAWVTGNEVTGTGYTAGGVVLSTVTVGIDTGSSSLCINSANPSWTTATISNIYGDLVYDNTISGGTVAAQGQCFNYFGGAQSVTAGTFTVQWATPAGAAQTAIYNIAV